MRVGFVLTPDDRIADASVAAEAAGYDLVACGEHLSHRVATRSALVALATAAAVTTRVQLVTDVLVLPLYPPALLAKLAVTLDRESGGRLELGLGIGEPGPDFELAGISSENRGAATDAALARLAQLFAGTTEPPLHPLPVRPGGPPLWIGGRSQAAIARAARWGGWLPYLYPAAHLAERAPRYRRLAAEAGNSEPRIAVHVWVTVTEERAQAREMAAELALDLYGQGFKERLDTYLVAGTPAGCVSRLLEYGEAGADLVLVMLMAPTAARPAMLELFASEVLPALQSRPSSTMMRPPTTSAG